MEGVRNLKCENSSVSNSSFIGAFVRNLNVSGLQLVPVWPLVPGVLGYQHRDIVKPNWWIENVSVRDLEPVVSMLDCFANVGGSVEISYEFTAANRSMVRIKESLYAIDGSSAQAISIWESDPQGNANLPQLKSRSLHGNDEAAADSFRLAETMGAALLHETRHPISIIALATDNALAQLKKVPSAQSVGYVRRKLEAIRNASNQMVELSNAISSIAVGENVSGHLSIGDLINDALALFEDHQKRKYIYSNINVKTENEETLVKGDPTLLKHMLLNLLLNSSDAIRMAEVEAGEIEITERTENGMVLLTVSDNGGGIVSGIRAQLFQLFKSVKTGGSGVGLSFASKVVSSLGGGIVCKSRKKGNGTYFEISLPIYRPETEAVKVFENRENCERLEC